MFNSWKRFVVWAHSSLTPPLSLMHGVILIWLVFWSVGTVSIDVGALLNWMRPKVAESAPSVVPNLGGSANNEPLFLAMCLVPFNLVMIGGWTWWLHHRRGAVGRLIHADGSRWVVKQAHGHALGTALIVASILSFTFIFLAGIGGWENSRSVLIANWIILLVATILTYRHARATIYFDPTTLMLDDAARTIYFPADGDQRPELTIDASSIRLVEIGDDTTTPASHPEVIPGYAVQISFNNSDNSLQRRTVHVTNSGRDAGLIAEWLEAWLRGNQ